MIMHFADQDVWQLSQLAEVTGLSEADLAQKLNFWVQNGIIVKEVRGEGGPDAQPVFVAAKNFVDGGMEVCTCLALFCFRPCVRLCITLWAAGWLAVRAFTHFRASLLCTVFMGR